MGGGLLLVAGLASCWPSPKPKAASTLKCPETQLVVESNTTYSDVVSGCGKSDVIVMEGGGKMSSLRERAIFELSCPDEQIAVTVLSSSLYGVTGCGKKVVYKYVPGVGIVADTTQGETPAGQPPASAQ
ncbi:MAG TPA: hypothetical protein VH853_13705 [Polyangia bacterium]|jgi:hypothetical protein|nr:hypothetical protein [Polyangia bacterium]